MKFTLKNFPKGDHNNIYKKWKKGFEKELREVFDHIELIEKQHGGKTIRNSARYDLIKEILGE